MLNQCGPCILTAGTRQPVRRSACARRSRCFGGFVRPMIGSAYFPSVSPARPAIRTFFVETRAYPRHPRINMSKVCLLESAVKPARKPIPSSKPQTKQKCRKVDRRTQRHWHRKAVSMPTPAAAMNLRNLLSELGYGRSRRQAGFKAPGAFERPILGVPTA